MARVQRPVKRGQIWWVDFNPQRGSEQAGRRPAVIVQTDIANTLEEYDVTIVVPISGGGFEDNPLHVVARASKTNGLTKNGYVRCEQILTIAKNRLDGYIGSLETQLMKQVDLALRSVLDLP